MAKRPADRPPSAAALGQALQRVQGDLGLSVTPLPLATPPPPRPATPAATRQGELSGDTAADAPLSPVPQPPAVAPAAATAPPSPASMAMRPVDLPAGGGDDEVGRTVTVGRTPPVPESDTTSARPGGHSTRRVVIGTVAGVVALLAVAVSLLLFGRGGDGSSASTTVAPPPTQIVEIRPPAPQDVIVTSGTDERQVVVSWSPVGDGSQDMRYVVAPETPGLAAQRVDAPTATFSLPEDLAGNPCFRVTAITPDGRISAASPLACR